MSRNGILSAWKEAVRDFLGQYGISVRRPPPAFSLHPHEVLRIDFDFVVRDFLASRPTPHDVSFVEIGAFDGVTRDPLHGYINRYDWRGLLVEPQPSYFQKLKEVYAGRDKLDFFQGAVGRDCGYRTLYAVNTAPDDVPASAGLLASFDRNTLLYHSAEREGSIPNLESRICEEEVRVEPLMDLLERYSLLDVDIVQIDVEGYDAEVVRMFDFGAVQPRIIQFEHKHLSNSDHLETVEFLISNGYSVAPSGKDTVAYRRPKNP